MIKHILYIILIVLSFAGCSKDPVGSEAVAYGELLTRIGTKSGNTGNVYRIYLNGIVGKTTEGIETSGTYYDDPDGDELVPCSIKNDYTRNEVGSEFGLRAPNGPYKMHIVYPAVEMEQIEGEANGITGYKIKRNRDGNSRDIYISSIKEVSVEGVYLTDSKGSYYVYDANETLKQQRSKIDIDFKCGDALNSAVLKKITLKNVIDEGFYRPAEQRFYYNKNKNISSNEIYVNVNGLEVTQGKTEPLNINEYILSMDYSEKDENFKPKWALPSLEIEIGGANPVIFTAGFGLDFKPEHNYKFTIIINSIYATMQVTVEDWEKNENGENSGTIGKSQTWEIDFPITDNNSSINLYNWRKVSGSGAIYNIN